MSNTNKSKTSELEGKLSGEKLQILTSVLDSIPLLKEVSKQGSLNKAAEAMHFSTPALSKRINNLEQLLGQPLLIRKRSGSKLTDFGKEVVEAYNPRLKDLKSTFESIIDGEENNAIIKEDNLPVMIPTPVPCASIMWELVADPISDNTLTFNFTPDGIPGTRVDFISMVYRFSSAVSLLNKSRIEVDVSFLSGDFNQINMEFHGEDSNNNMNIYAPPVKLMRKSPEQPRNIYNIPLEDTFERSVLERLREICFVVPLYVIIKAEEKSGSFKINNISIM